MPNALDAMDDHAYLKRRGEFKLNTMERSKKPPDDDWYKNHMKPLLVAHYERMKDIALGDVEFMLDTGDRKMTAQRHCKDYKVVKVGSLAMPIIKEWYENKMEKLREMKGPETVERDPVAGEWDHNDVQGRKPKRIKLKGFQYLRSRREYLMAKAAFWRLFQGTMVKDSTPEEVECARLAAVESHRKLEEK